ncbi:MAG: outer membrane lipoprotein-sorting protein [Pseudomonadota bacterium]|nr:outer membrane lipoprotein-sorting protein [Pseudomonadota bacterium]
MNMIRRTMTAVGVLALLTHATISGAVDAKSRQAALAADAKVVAAAAAKVGNPALAPEHPSAPVALPPMTAEQIVERNVAARGGLAAWQHVQAIAMQGKLDAGQRRRDGGNIGLTKRESKELARKTLVAMSKGSGVDATASPVIQLPFALELQRPNKMRLEIPFQGQTAVQVFDGAQGWKLRPFLGRHEVEPYTQAEIKSATSDQQLDGPLINHKAKGIRVAVDGTEAIEGHNAYRLKLTLPSGDQRHLWVDANTFLDLKFEGTPRLFDGRMRSVATYFSDYKPVNGVQIARLLETRVEGVRRSERILIEQVALNPPLDATRFARPE